MSVCSCTCVDTCFEVYVHMCVRAYCRPKADIRNYPQLLFHLTHWGQGLSNKPRAHKYDVASLANQPAPGSPLSLPSKAGSTGRSPCHLHLCGPGARTPVLTFARQASPAEPSPQPCKLLSVLSNCYPIVQIFFRKERNIPKYII